MTNSTSIAYIDKVSQLAFKYHQGQIRKGDNTPYIIHPLMVGLILQSYGYGVEVVAAGYCHDLLEDTVCSSEEIVNVCGERVLKLVEFVTQDPALDDLKDWEEKKRRYKEHLKMGPDDAIAVSCADKLHNLTTLHQALEREGEVVWSRFNRGREVKGQNERDNLKLFMERLGKHSMVVEYERVVAEVFGFNYA